MTPSLKRSFEVFSCLCGDSAYPSITLGTTKWPEITSSLHRNHAESRLKVLEDDYWNDLIRLGARTYRIDTTESALQLVRSILDKLELTTEGGELVLQIQKEVVNERKGVLQRKAGKILEREGRKNRYAGMTKEEKAADKFIQKEKKEMDRQLAKLAANKNSRVSGWLARAL